MPTANLGGGAEGAAKGIQTDPELGMSPEERAATMGQARFVCRVLNLLTVICCLWIWIYPRPYDLAVASLLLLPWVAIYITSRYEGVVVINQQRNDPRPMALFAFMVPSLVLPLRVIPDMVPVGWERPVLLGMAVAAVLTYAAYRADKASQKQPVIAVVLFMLSIGYGYGSVMETDALFDRTPPTVYSTTVKDKYITHGKSSSYHLVLAPWGPMPGGDNVTVTRQFYNATTEDGPVCITLRSGALGISWYSMHLCE